MKATHHHATASPPVDTTGRDMTSTENPVGKPPEPLWTTKDLAKFFGCSDRQIPRLRDEGLPTVRVGGLVRFIPARVMAWLESKDERAGQPATLTQAGNAPVPPLP